MSGFPPVLKKMTEEAISEFTASTDGLTDYRLKDSQTHNQDDQMQVCFASVLGYSGDLMKGSIVISCQKTLLEKSHPNIAMEMPVGDAEVLDWIGEIANQMLGRLKNKVTQAGVKFSMSTPTTVSGRSMQVTIPKDGFALKQCYTGPHGELIVHLLTVVDPSVKFDAVQPTSVAAEGGSILF